MTDPIAVRPGAGANRVGRPRLSDEEKLRAIEARRTYDRERYRRMTGMSKSKTVAYGCGCVNVVDPVSGVLRSIEKCRKHRALQRDPATLDAAYYRELGVLAADGTLAETMHVAELTEALGPLPRAKGRNAVALEIGPGASPYVPTILDAGYRYLGLDPSGWACDWLGLVFDVDTICATVEADSFPDGEFDLILAAHVFEHLADAPGQMARVAAWLAPGGELWVVVPDDEDPVNPDHLWFWTLPTLCTCLEAAGLKVEREAVRRYVPQEQFLYVRARKPTQ